MKITNSTYILFIALVTVIVFAGSLNNGFAWDDIFLIVDNPYVKSWDYLPRIFSSYLYEGNDMQSNFYRPLQLISFTIDYSLWKLNPFGYHLSSLLLHVINSSLVYIILLGIGSSGGIAFASALLFAIAPVISGTTYYISARSDLLMALFLFSSFLLFSKYIDHRKKWIIVLSLCFFIASLLSKEMAFILPALLLLETWRRRLKARKETLKLILPYLTVLVVYIVGRVSVLNFSKGPGAFIDPGFPSTIPLWRRILTDFKVIPEYLKLFLFPYELHMDRFIEPAKSLFQADVLFSVIILIVLAFFVKKLYRRNRLVLFGVLWFLISLLPVLNIYPISAFFGEGWLYLPSVGFFIVLGIIYQDIIRRKVRRLLVYILMLTFLAYYSFFTILHGKVWKDSISLLQNVMLYEENNPFIYLTYNNLAGSYYRKQEYDNSIKYYRKSIEANPRYAAPYDNLGAVYADIGKHVKAIKCFKISIGVNRDYLNAYCNLAQTYYNIGFKEKAVSLLMAVIDKNPNFYKSYYNLGFIYLNEKENNKATEFFKKSVELKKHDPVSHYCLGNLYLKDGKFKEALDEYDLALRLGIKADYNFFNELAFLYVRTNRFQSAWEALIKSLSLESNQASAHNNLANLYCTFGDFDMAIEEHRKALSIEPENLKMRENLIKTKSDWKDAIKRKL